MKVRLPSKLCPLSNYFKQPITASLLLSDVSLSSWTHKFIAPALIANSWTSLLFWQIELRIEQANFLMLSPGWEKIRLINSCRPPNKQKFKLLRGCISTRSNNSSSKSVIFSYAISVEDLSSFITSFILALSSKVYAFIAESSHSLSSFIISLN